MSGVIRKKANEVMESVQTRTERWVSWVKGTTLKVIGVVLLVTLQLWISLFLYGSFYYSYMPTVAHISPVYLQFSSCLEYGTQSNCPFPSVNATIVKNLESGSLLMRGQRYRVLLELEMPQSPVNENLGMFMVRLDVFSLGGEITASSSRPAMMHYRSGLLKTIQTLLFSPFMLSGYSEEKQNVQVNLIENFVDNPYKPMIGAHIQLQARQLQMYSSVLKIQAYFSGLRYLMYHWPISTAVFFISIFFLFLSLISVLSWQQCVNAFSSQEETVVRMDDVYSMAYEERRKMIKKNMETERAALFRGHPTNVKTIGDWDDRESHSSGISSVGMTDLADQGSSIMETTKVATAKGSPDESWELLDKPSTSNGDVESGVVTATGEDEAEIKMAAGEEQACEQVVEKTEGEGKEQVEEEEAERVGEEVDEEVEEEGEVVKEDVDADEDDNEGVISGSAVVMEKDDEPVISEGEQVEEEEEEKAGEEGEGKVDEEVKEDVDEDEDDYEEVEGVAGGSTVVMETDNEPLVPEGEELRQRFKDPDTTFQ